MFSFSLIVERGKVSRLPIPYAVVAVSNNFVATSHMPVVLLDAPNVKPKNSPTTPTPQPLTGITQHRFSHHPLSFATALFMY
jgi:hypothetical protein